MPLTIIREDIIRSNDAGDKQAIEEARRSLTAKIRVFAKEIHDKYIVLPPAPVPRFPAAY